MANTGRKGAAISTNEAGGLKAFCAGTVCPENKLFCLSGFQELQVESGLGAGAGWAQKLREAEGWGMVHNRVGEGLGPLLPPLLRFTSGLRSAPHSGTGSITPICVLESQGNNKLR